jgi:transposase
VHGIDERGKAVLRKELRRAQVAVLFGNMPPCLIGMEACASALHWARTLQGFGHTVWPIGAQFEPVLQPLKADTLDLLTLGDAVNGAWWP